MVDITLDAFLLANTPWCLAVLTGVSSMHASTAKIEDGISSPPPPSGESLQQRGSNGTNSDINTVVGGAVAMSSIIRKGMLANEPSPSPEYKNNGIASQEQQRTTPKPPLDGTKTNGAKPNSSRGVEGDDDPIEASLCLHLLRRVLQAGGADARLLAAGVGVATEGAGRRGEEAANRTRRGPSMEADNAGEEGRELYNDDFGIPTADERGWHEGGGRGWEAEGVGKGRGGRVRCGPPLTPALEVAVRLMADGYHVAVMLQVKGGVFCCCWRWFWVVVVMAWW